MLDGLLSVSGVKVRKLTRVLSGVAPVAVMAKPYPCPHGRCVYCPGGPDRGTPQSYVGDEPALMRAVRVGFDPYDQVHTRLSQYDRYLGFFPSKVELIIMGGTFLAYPQDYQEWFVTEVFRALNDYPNIRKGVNNTSLELEHLRNESAGVRCVGLTIETRPDWGMEKHADLMLKFGATKVELGVQSIYDDVLERVRRGHKVKHTIESTRVLRDSGFKITYHIMPGLPGSDFERDVEMIKTLFEDPDFRPDYLKIYPTLVMEGTELYDMWVKGEYKALSDSDAVELICEMYKYIPKYVRIQRIQRDVPSQLIIAGPKSSNLRELVEETCLKKGIQIREIRWREVARRVLKDGVAVDEKNLQITRLTYEAGQGYEIFLAVEDVINDLVVGILRLRIPSDKAHRPEVKEGKTAIVRELHVYGIPIGLGGKASNILEWQHRGWGRKLLLEAERIALEEYDAKKILVLSGVGVRQYYARLGYSRPSNSSYMVKYLT
ncbi:MAG: tRNA uridine(34) 5-carboxymethylaminomethyl modification radical SAM/GNAT enzyme Elp3 [Zestosphaera tikiterensis]|uniref:tRNA carboxymethyluridine synthase n=1 Tax=Zestosphaera tikiterensis TaxID=1973259 RepID=A0A2R7Y784_9CREN|nr:MAG: tRNA uridine(34) 5-carboxymethylaminomethyl modification radical SAM/GNAT enzyme Elp3 [Zestosphaera tikiterensis]